MTEEEKQKLYETRAKRRVYQQNRADNMSEEKRAEVRTKNLEAQRRRSEKLTSEEKDMEKARDRINDKRRREVIKEVKNSVILEKQKQGLKCGVHYTKHELDV